MSEEDVEALAEDALQVAQRALAKVNGEEKGREELEKEVNYLERRVLQLEARTSADDAEYANLSKNQKIGILREELVKRAQNTASGWAKMDYKDIWRLFDRNPSADHCYTLMEKAADAEGFTHKTPDGAENEYVGVDLEKAKQGVAFSSAKKPARGEGL